MPTGIYPRTKEHKEKISIANKGHIVTEETRRKISKSNKGKIYLLKMKINCKSCGVEVKSKRSTMKFCKKCLIIHKKRIRKEYYQKHKKEEYEQTKIWKSKNKDRVKENWERWYQKNKVRIKKKRKNEDIKEGRRKDAEKYSRKYPEKTKAHSKAYYHIKIPKGKLCQDCNTNLATERHHEDYSKQLEVVFLCKECHTKRTLGG